MAHGRGVGPLDSNGTSYEDPVHAPAEQAGHPDHRQGRGPEEVGGLMVEHDRAGAGRGQEQAGGDDGVQEAVLVQDLPLPAAMRGPHQRLRPPREQWIVRDKPADDGLAEPEQPAVAVEPEPTESFQDAAAHSSLLTGLVQSCMAGLARSLLWPEGSKGYDFWAEKYYKF